MNVTLFELHLPDAQFNAPFSGRSETADDDDRTVAADSESTGGPGPLVVLLAVAGLALLARHLRSGDAEQATLDEIEA